MERATIQLYPFNTIVHGTYDKQLHATNSCRYERHVITRLRGSFLSSSTLFRTKKDITSSAGDDGFTTISRALPQSCFCVLLWTFLIDTMFREEYYFLLDFQLISC